MSRFFVYAPRAEVRTAVPNEQGFGFSERVDRAPHTATQISVFGRTIDATPEGDFEVSEEEHRDLVHNHGFEHSRIVEDEPEQKKPSSTKKADA